MKNKGLAIFGTLAGLTGLGLVIASISKAAARPEPPPGPPITKTNVFSVALENRASRPYSGWWAATPPEETPINGQLQEPTDQVLNIQSDTALSQVRVKIWDSSDTVIFNEIIPGPFENNNAYIIDTTNLVANTAGQIPQLLALDDVPTTFDGSTFMASASLYLPNPYIDVIPRYKVRLFIGNVMASYTQLIENPTQTDFRILLSGYWHRLIAKDIPKGSQLVGVAVRVEDYAKYIATGIVRSVGGYTYPWATIEVL